MNKVKLCTNVAGAGVIAGCLALGSTAWAEAAASDAGPQLGEVIVTAQRRTENLQKVPVMVRAVSAADLQQRAVSDLLELQRVTPSLTVQDTASNISPFIRGVGTTLTGAGQSPSVATYVDGVYVSTLGSAAFDLDTAEQVEVLSGPQGALYGRNATGGAIVITSPTPRPGAAPHFGGRLSYGNYNAVTASAYASGALSDTFAGYLAGSLQRRAGYVKNLDPAGLGPHHDDLNDRDAWNVEGALTYAPTSRFTVVLHGAHFQAKDRQGVGLQAVGLDIPVAGSLNGSQAYYAGLLQNLGFPASAAGAAGAALQFSTRTGQTYDNEANGYTRGLLTGDSLPGSFVALKVDRGSLRIAYRFDHLEVSSLTAYSQVQNTSATEIILANPATYPASLQGGAVGFSGNFPSRDVQEDFQVTSIDTPVRYVAGLFYFDGRGDTDLTGDLPPLSARTALNTWSSRSIAAYAQVTVPLVSNWAATVGGRYTDERYRIDDHLTLSTPGNLFGTPNTGDQHKNSSQATYTARLEYQSDGLLAYAGVSTGFKGATLSAVNPASPGVDPETITAYEAGLKWDVAGAFRLNASVFHYVYDNIHIAYTDTATGANVLVNGTGARLTGLEYQALYRPNEWLSLRTSGLLLQSSYNDDVRAAGSVPVLRTKGNRLAGAPRAVIDVGADIRLPVVSSGDLKLVVDVTHNAGYWFDAENLIGTGGAQASAFTTVDASLTYHPHGAKWRVALYGVNLGDEKYFQSGIAASGILRAALAATPRLYGLRVNFDF